METQLKKILTTVVSALVAMAGLAACEKGVFMKDIKITAPDFKITTGGETDTSTQYEIDLKSLIVSDDAAVEGGPSFTGLLEFTVTNKTLSQEIKVQLSAQARQDKQTSGRIETKPGEPEMTWQARCNDANCSHYYLVIAFHFNDDKGKFQDLRYLVIGWYRDEKQVKRTLLEYDPARVTLASMVKALEEMDSAQTVPGAAAAGAGTGETAATGEVAPTGELTGTSSEESEEVLSPPMSSETAPSGSVLKTEELPATEAATS